MGRSDDHPSRFRPVDAGLVVYEEERPFNEYETHVHDLADGSDRVWSLPFDYNYYYTRFSGGLAYDDLAVYDLKTGSRRFSTPEDCTIAGAGTCFCDPYYSEEAFAGRKVLLLQRINCIQTGPAREFARFRLWDLDSGAVSTVREGELDESTYHPYGNLAFGGRWATYPDLAGPDSTIKLLDTQTGALQDAPQGALLLEGAELLLRDIDAPTAAYRLKVQDLATSQRTDLTPSTGTGQFQTAWLTPDAVVYQRINEDGFEHGYYLADRTTHEERLLAASSSPTGRIDDFDVEPEGRWAVMIMDDQVHYLALR